MEKSNKEIHDKWVTKAVMTAAHVYNITPEDVVKKTKGEKVNNNVRKAKKLAMSILENKRMDLQIAAKYIGYSKMGIGTVISKLKSHPIQLKDLVEAAEFYNKISL